MVFSSSLQHPNPFIQCMGLINFKSMFTVGDVVLLGDLFFNSYAQLLCLQHEELPLSVEGVLKKVSF